nr:hypothetical protein Cduv_109 [Cedratvirus duvanny]
MNYSRASLFLEEQINQAGEGEEVTLLRMYIEDKEDLCLVPELDQNKVCFIIETTLMFSSQVELAMHDLIGQGQANLDHLEQILHFTFPVLTLTLCDGLFHYNLDKEYQVQISKNSALKILKHSLLEDD